MKLSLRRFWTRLAHSFAEPEHRLRDRMREPSLCLDIGGVAYSAQDWSVGGAALEGFRGDVAVGDILTGTAGGPQFDDRHRFTAQVARTGSDGFVALQWLDLPPEALRAMQRPRHRNE